MDIVLGGFYWLLITLMVLGVTARICRRNAALRPWSLFLIVAALIWMAMPLAKKFYIDDILPPGDALGHELIARTVADLISEGRFLEAGSYFGIGNPAYRFSVGVFYALTGAPEVVTYAVNGALAFWGLLILLEVLCLQSRCKSVPLWIVVAVALLPSGLLWTTTNLKEGPVLWGICAMLHFTVYNDTRRLRRGALVPIAGALVVAILRPQISICWLAGMGIATAVTKRNLAACVLTVAGAAASFILIMNYSPTMYEASVADGFHTVLGDRYERLSADDELGRLYFAGGQPTPVLSGLILIVSRPWPNEVVQTAGFIAGLEVWVLGSIGLFGWLRTRDRVRKLLVPAMASHFFALLLLALYFSYMYNMGLMVRQRVMCFPALLSLYAWPALTSRPKQVLAKRIRSFRPGHRVLPRVVPSAVRVR